MPNRWPIVSGNWSNAAIWSGSIIPTASDDVFSNNQIVTVDTNINVLSLRNAASASAITAGGQFILLNNVIVTASISSSFTNNSVSTFNSFIEISQSNSAIIVGDITTRPGSGNYKYAVKTLDSSNLIISGNLIAGGVSSFQTPLLHSSIGTVNISGNVTAGSAAGDYGISLITSGSLYVNGNVNAGGAGSSYGINNIGANSFLKIIGNVTGATAAGILNSVFSNINITGSIISTFAPGISNTAISIIQVTGSVRSQSPTGQPGISSAVNGIISVIGPISSSITTAGVTSTGTGATNLFTGPFYNTGSYNAVYAYRMQMLSTSSQWTFDTETAGITKTLYTSNILPGVPRQTDVRKGTTYNFGLTGSLAMPDPTTVKQGVLTDNVTGSAILTPQDMFDTLTQDLTVSSSIGTLLTGSSTVQTVGATISSFKV